MFVMNHVYEFKDDKAMKDFIHFGALNKSIAEFIDTKKFMAKKVNSEGWVYSIAVVNEMGFEVGPTIILSDIIPNQAREGEAVLSRGEVRYFRDVTWSRQVESEKTLNDKVYSVMASEGGSGYFIRQRNLTLEEAEKFASEYAIENGGTVIVFKGISRFNEKKITTSEKSDY